MKTLDNFCSKTGYIYKAITYRSQGFKVRRKGYDIIDQNGAIVVQLEPVDYSNGDKWFIGGHSKYRGVPSYIKRVSRSFFVNLHTAHKNLNY